MIIPMNDFCSCPVVEFALFFQHQILYVFNNFVLSVQYEVTHLIIMFCLISLNDSKTSFYIYEGINFISYTVFNSNVGEKLLKAINKNIINCNYINDN